MFYNKNNNIFSRNLYNNNNNVNNNNRQLNPGQYHKEKKVKISQ